MMERVEASPLRVGKLPRSAREKRRIPCWRKERGLREEGAAGGSLFVGDERDDSSVGGGSNVRVRVLGNDPSNGCSLRCYPWFISM